VRKFEELRFEVPTEILPELHAAGYLRSTPGMGEGGPDVGEWVLAVYNTGASTVTLLQTPGVIRALAHSLAQWFSRDKRDYPFHLAAFGPHGRVDFTSDVAPDPQELADFLRRNVWGDSAPPDPDDKE
jgi:hypothetical protein